MNFNEIKYLLALFRSEALYDRPVPIEVPEGFKESFESQSNFRGWSNYHVTWDVFEDDPWKCVLREKSQEQEWNEVLEKVVPVIVPEGEIVSAEEWEKRSASMK
jgi:hypothetical protein